MRRSAGVFRFPPVRDRGAATCRRRSATTVFRSGRGASGHFLSPAIEEAVRLEIFSVVIPAFNAREARHVKLFQNIFKVLWSPSFGKLPGSRDIPSLVHAVAKIVLPSRSTQAWERLLSTRIKEGDAMISLSPLDDAAALAVAKAAWPLSVGNNLREVARYGARRASRQRLGSRGKTQYRGAKHPRQMASAHTAAGRLESLLRTTRRWTLKAGRDPRAPHPPRCRPTAISFGASRYGTPCTTLHVADTLNKRRSDVPLSCSCRASFTASTGASCRTSRSSLSLSRATGTVTAAWSRSSRRWSPGWCPTARRLVRTWLCARRTATIWRALAPAVQSLRASTACLKQGHAAPTQVDEFQDTSTEQWKVVHELTTLAHAPGLKRVTMIGEGSLWHMIRFERMKAQIFSPARR